MGIGWLERTERGLRAVFQRGVNGAKLEGTTREKRDLGVVARSCV